MTSKQLTMSSSPSTIVVVKDKVASDVARAMIESGDQKEPFYIFDFDAAYACVKKIRDEMPRVQIFYAMKANDHPMMLKLAISLGLGFDCASPGEINKIMALDVPPTSIIYAVTMKTPEQMTFARQSGVRHTTFDSMGELKRLKQYWPDSKLLIRVKVEKIECVYDLGDKFGCEKEEAFDLLDEARCLGMDVVGVAFHVGSACLSIQSYEVGLQTARTLFDYEARAGKKMKILDIGGGFFIYNPTSFTQAASVINKGLAKWFPEEEIQITAEPGRYICESSFTLYTNIRDIRKVTESGREMSSVYLNNGANGTLKYVEKWHTVNVFKDMVENKNRYLPLNTLIWGPTFDDNDFLGPMKLAQTTPNDWLVFHDQGAYSLVFKSNYCGVEKTSTRSIVSKDLWTTIRENPVFSSNMFMMYSDKPPVLASTLPPLCTKNNLNLFPDYGYEGFKTHITPALVLKTISSDNVAKAIIKRGEQKQPFHVFNMDVVNRRVRHLHLMMPRLKIFYATKANDTDCMLRLAAALQIGFSCPSVEHIFTLRKLDVNANNIIYSMPCKTVEEMDYARKSGVQITIFDNFYELSKIKMSWSGARLLLRFKVEDISTKQSRTKFGCDLLEATNLLDEAAKLGLKVTGVAFQVDSSSPEEYVSGLQQAKMLFDYEAKNGRQMYLVDIGGGFLSDTTDQIDEVSHHINKALEELFPGPGVEVIAEPGRYLCDSAFTLYCSIIGVRQGNVIRQDTKCNERVNMIYLNDGVHGTMRLDDDVTKLRKFQLSSEIESILDQPTILWGPTCNTIDHVFKHHDIKLPPCSANDWLVLDNHGAYTFSYSTRFSTVEIPSVRPIVSMDLWKRIKCSPVYQSSDFILNPDISEALLSTLPPVLPVHNSSGILKG